MSIAFDRSALSNPESVLGREWLDTNGIGGWAASSLAGAHTRRYHGLLVAALHPPTGRHVLLSKLDESVVVAGTKHELGCNRFPGAIHPDGHLRLMRFSRDLFPVFEYEAGGVALRKTVACVHGENTVIVAYEVLDAPGTFTLELRPFVAYRDYHATSHANGFLRGDATFENGLFRTRPYDGLPELFLSVPGAAFEAGGAWWRDFEYDLERERGLGFREDLYTHGTFRRTLRGGDRFAVIVSTATPAGRDAWALLESERLRREAVVAPVAHLDGFTRALALAADAFVVARGERGRTVIAGYPWFTDWGRDTLIALPGLCLATGRLGEAREILRALAGRVSQGMVPNRFPDDGGQPEYNAVDTTLWLFVAAHRYLVAGGDPEFIVQDLLPILEDVLAWHDRGTRYGIRVDTDGLLAAGISGVPVTWMDAKVADWVVTPRQGKAVEVNALWYNALMILADFRALSGNAAGSRELAARAKAVRARFEEVFWNAEAGCLYDVVDGERRDASIRPNQIFALSLPHTLLAREKARKVLEVVEARLATPVGLRSLDPADPAYRPRYEGGPAERDGAYHQGTVWSWLLGPWTDALVKTLGAPGKARARKAIEGILPHLAEAGVGAVSEIFDGDAPHAPRGCPAQAWSVAEVFRAWKSLAADAPARAKAKDAPAKKSYRIVKAKDASAPRRRAKSPEAE